MTTVEKINPRLKTIYIEFPKVAPVDLEVEIYVPHLVIAIFTPEVPMSVETAINRLNLLPYEQAVQKFSGCDYQYNTGSINNPGIRVIKGLDVVAANTSDTNGQCPVIISYIEFPTL